MSLVVIGNNSRKTTNVRVKVTKDELVVVTEFLRQNKLDFTW